MNSINSRCDATPFLTKESVYFFFGLLPVMGTLLYFKIQFAPRNDMINIPTLKKTAFHLLDIDRYIVVIQAILKKIFTFNDGVVVLMAVYFFNFRY